MSKMFLTKGERTYPRGTEVPRTEVTCPVCDRTVIHNGIKVKTVTPNYCPACKHERDLCILEVS
jgi:rubrerythrin